MKRQHQLRLLAVVIGLPALFVSGFASAAIFSLTQSIFWSSVVFQVVAGMATLALLCIATKNFAITVKESLRGVL